MAKAQFTFKVDSDKLQEMKIRAIQENCPLNELLENAYDIYVGLQYELFCIKNARNEEIKQRTERDLIDYLFKIIDVKR